jgi:hypothetical protein
MNVRLRPRPRRRRRLLLAWRSGGSRAEEAAPSSPGPREGDASGWSPDRGGRRGAGQTSRRGDGDGDDGP